MIRVFQQYVSAKSVLLLLLEGILMPLCVFSAVKLRFWSDPMELAVYTMLPDFGFQILVFTIVTQVCLYHNDLYDLSTMRNRSEAVLRLWQSLGAASILLSLVYFLLPRLEIGRGVFFIALALVAAATSLTRITLDAAWRGAGPKQKFLILGLGELAMTVGRELNRREDLNAELTGFVATQPRPEGSGPGQALCGRPVIGTLPELARLVEEHKISRLVIALEDHRSVLPVKTLVNLRVRGLEIQDAHTALAALTGRVWLETVRPSWFVYSEGFHRSRLTAVLKRSLDLACGIVGLALSLPVMAAVALAIKLDSPGPVLYRQRRVGLSGRVFDVIKFRSMRTDAEASGKAQWASKDDPRVTRLGRLLRKYRLDELPQYVNVIRGDMSFVGPRPERPEFVEQLREQIPFYDERHTVRPGLTGWAQVCYPYGASVEETLRKLEYDLFYLKNMSVLFDCLIVFRTIQTVIFGKGAR